MIATYHRLVKNDLKSIVSYYQTQGGPELADALIEEFNARIKDALENPNDLHFIKAMSGE